MAMCPSVTSRSSTETDKCRITQTKPHDSTRTLVFWRQRSPRNLTGVKWGRQIQVGWIQEAQLSPSVRAMCLVSSNLANYHATVQKLLIRQVLTKLMVWSWRFSWRQCVINKPTMVELCISPVYRRLAVAKFSKSTIPQCRNYSRDPDHAHLWDSQSSLG